MNIYSVRKSNGNSGYVSGKNEAEAAKTALKGTPAGTTVTRITFVKKAS